MNWKLPSTAAMLAALVSTAAASQPATQPSSNDVMQKKILDLQARIDRLQSHLAGSQAAEKAAVSTMPVNAGNQCQFFSIGTFASGYDSNVGFVLQSADGNFSMHPGLLIQARGVANDRNRILPNQGGITARQSNDIQDGFELTRVRFSLDGNVISPLLTYYIQVGQDAQSTTNGLLDAYAMYRVSAQSPLAIKIGQFKDPAWHEQNLLPSRQMAVDRSVLNALVGGGQTNRLQGAAIVFDQDAARGQIALDDGYNGTNTPFFGPSGLGATTGAGAGLAPTNWGASGRGEYLLVGERSPDYNPYNEYDQFSARGAKLNILVVGGGFDYSESGANKIIFHTVDAQFTTTTGWSFYGAYLGAYRNLYTNRGTQPGSYYDSGFLVQAAYLLTRRFEPFARFDYTHLDGKALPGIHQDKIDEITIGANYYLLGDQAKITVDGSWLPIGSPTDINYLDILQNNSHNEYILRAQFQIAI